MEKEDKGPESHLWKNHENQDRNVDHVVAKGSDTKKYHGTQGIPSPPGLTKGENK